MKMKFYTTCLQEDWIQCKLRAQNVPSSIQLICYERPLGLKKLGLQKIVKVMY